MGSWNTEHVWLLSAALNGINLYFSISSVSNNLSKSSFLYIGFSKLGGYTLYLADINFGNVWRNLK